MSGRLQCYAPASLVSLYRLLEELSIDISENGMVVKDSVLHSRQKFNSLFAMQARLCHCERTPASHSRQHTFLPTSTTRLRQHVRHCNHTLESTRKKICTGTRCRSAQPGLDAGTSSNQPQQQAGTRGPISAEGRDVYWPQSFKEITEDAVKAVLAAVEKGFNRLEVEFPPLPTSDSKPWVL